MDWPGVLALIGLLVVVRMLILSHWRSYRLSHRQAALLYAAVIPLLLVAAFAATGISSVEQLLIVTGIALFAFVSTFAIAEFFFRAFGGEMDPPTSRGYRRRP